MLKRITNFYLEVKEEQETMMEKTEQYDSELSKLGETNTKLKKSIKLLKDDFSTLTQKQGTNSMTQVPVLFSTSLLKP